MKLDSVKNAPEWLKIHPESKIYWVDIYRANARPPRLTKTTKIRGSKERARAVGDAMIARWLGTTLDGRVDRKLFQHVADQVLESQKNNRKRTYENARIYIKKLTEEFGHLYVDQITEGMWLSFETRFRHGNPGKFFFNHHKHMSLVMNRAYKLGAISRPWRPTLPKDKSKPAKVLTTEEKTALLDTATPELRDQLVFAMTMGMRLREHLMLSWEQVDLAERTIRLDPEHTKTKKGRKIIMSPQVYEVLCRRRKKIGTDIPWVFPSKFDKTKPTWTNKKAWIAAKERAEIKGRCRYHDLRHTFLTECAKLIRTGRMSIALVCAYTGVSIRVFERTYLHLSHDDTAGVAEMIAVKLRES